MNCCQCQGVEELFSPSYVSDELANYRKKGPDRTTQMLVQAIQETGIEGLTLLDIGGGVGAIQHELLGAGVDRATDVEASSAYLTAAKEEAQRRGLADRVSFLYGDFTQLAAGISPADIVTLDRVICCYADVEKLVSLSAARVRKLYGLVYPRDTWWIKLGLGLQNFFFRLRRNPYRGYIHPTREVENILGRYGLKRNSYRRTFVWQVVVYTR